MPWEVLMGEGATPPKVADGSDAKLTRKRQENYSVDSTWTSKTSVPTMAVLSFSLSAEATGRIYESLVCLAKFGESVSLEAKKDKVPSYPFLISFGIELIHGSSR